MNPRTSSELQSAMILITAEARRTGDKALWAMVATLEWALDSDSPMIIVEADLGNYRYGKTLLTIE